MVFLAWFVIPANADFDAGMAAYVGQDYATALREWTPLADHGDARAQFNLGVMYANGQGVPQNDKNDKEALRWYRLAANQGHADAQATLGTLHVMGEVLPQDYREALRWYRLAAEQRHAGAQYNLGIMYAKGYGVLQDYVQAYMWWSLAAIKGDEMASNARNKLAEKMSRSQIAEAQRLAREWKPKQ